MWDEVYDRVYTAQHVYKVFENFTLNFDNLWW